ncbi:hypothetical protein [Streptomyces hoynatensis]|uniref:Peptidoglycan binding domain-containing protein n=1 Tax=Streptomyces hoynatensis TaxID=1141874 RepID=A0A3A9ZF40_9ACTN|nr:hypothetical protein [Streptomyces hoynatensis]RKN47072.1 hypothetical protein D7294_02510 [Streptomyces hoynatensis]
MTTRARINIPGSRPIPPIVVRETVNEPEPREAPAPRGQAPTTEAAAAPSGNGPGKKTSSWFEPRKPPAPRAEAPREQRPKPAAPQAERPAFGSSSDTAPFGTSSFEAPPAERHFGAGAPGGEARFDAFTGAAGEAGFGAAGTGFGEARPAATPPGPARTDTPPGGHPAVTETPAGGVPAAGSPLSGPGSGPGTGPIPGIPGPMTTPDAPGADAVPRSADWFSQHPEGTPSQGLPHLPRRPVGPTAGPATGEMALPVREPSAEPAGAGRPGPVPGMTPEEAFGSTMDLGGPFPPAPPADVTATGPMPALADPPSGGFRAATAPGPGAAEVPPPGPRPPAPEPEEAGPPPAAPKKQAPAKGGGRSRLRLAALAVVGLAVVAYGAGLYLSPEDVPTGTTVLGVDIGGLSSQEAVNRLDSEFEQANNAPLTLRIGEQEVELKPSVAGLSVDTEATVRSLSGQDYNPVSVYGSLIGAEHARQATFVVDRDKLTVALEDAAEGMGSGPVEGSVTFEPTGAIAHVGEPGMAVDVDAAADAVEAAFRERAATGRNEPIEIPLTEQEPEIDEAEVRRAMEEFAEPAMSASVFVQAGGVQIEFSPQNSLWQFLGMEAVDGKLVDTYDLDTLQELYGHTFDGVLVTRGDGSSTPVTPEDVVGALRPALRETDPAQRVGVIDLDPS